MLCCLFGKTQTDIDDTVIQRKKKMAVENVLYKIIFSRGILWKTLSCFAIFFLFEEKVPVASVSPCTCDI